MGQNLHPKLYRQNMTGATCAGGVIHSHASRSATNHILQRKYSGPSEFRRASHGKQSRSRQKSRRGGCAESGEVTSGAAAVIL